MAIEYVPFYSRMITSLFDETLLMGVSKGFFSLFGRPENTGVTVFSPNANILDIDIMRAEGGIAPMVQRGGGDIKLNLKGTKADKGTTVSREYPLIQIEGSVSAAQLNRRLLGQSAYEAPSKEAVLRELLAIQHKNQMYKILRTFELNASEAILTGKMKSIIATTNTELIYDFYRKPTHIYTPAAKWDSGSPDILGDLDDACDLIRKDSYMTPDIAIMGSDAFKVFMQDETVLGFADNRRVETVEVKRLSTDNMPPSNLAWLKEAGFMPRAWVRTYKGYDLWIYTYIDTYEDLSDTTQNYMPVEQCLITSSKARCDRYFGPNEMLPVTPTKQRFYSERLGMAMTSPMIPQNAQGGMIDPRMFYADAWEEPRSQAVEFMLQSAFLPVPIQTDAYVTLTDLIT